MSSKTVKQRAEGRKFCVCGNPHWKFKIISVGVFLRSGVGVFPFGVVAQQVSLCGWVFERMQNTNNQIPEIERGK